MRLFGVRHGLPQHNNSTCNDANKLEAGGSLGMQAALATAAFLLVLSSAGFGCVFAWQQGQHHGPALAALGVAMALGLELAKPFAVESIFDCVRRLAIGRAAAMLVLAGVAVGYSLSAELSLMASSRGDATAEREAVADARSKAASRYKRAEAELSALAPSRPAAELQALLGATDCGEAVASKIRTLCAEHGRATRRGELQALLDKAEADTTTARPAVGAGDAGAAALSTLLAQFGLAVPAAALSTWLTLVGVLALEVGSSLAVVLCRSMPADKACTKGSKAALGLFGSARPAAPHTAAVDPGKAGVDSRTPALSTAAERATVPESDPVCAPARTTRAAVADAIVDTVRRQGGRVPKGSVRQLGKAVGASKSTAHLALVGLLAAGILERVAGDLVLRS